jgi:hypothetical protein
MTFQKPQLLHQTVVCFPHSMLLTVIFFKVTAHNSFYKSHSPTKHTLVVLWELW